MIRPFTLLCLLAALGSGLYLYSEKHKAELLDKQIAKVVHETQSVRERTGMLRAEWALLNEPSRLQDLADKYLKLQKMAPSQFVRLTDLPQHLPAVEMASRPGEGTDEDAAENPAGASGGDAPAGPVAAPPDMGKTEAIASVALKGPAPETARRLAKVVIRSPEAPREVAARPAAGRSVLQAGALPLAAPRPLGASVMTAMATPRPAPPPPLVAPAPPPRPLVAAPTVGSALGGRFALPPPVPYGAQ